MWSNSDSSPNPGLAHGLTGFIHQPKPRAPSPVFEFVGPACPPAPTHSLPTPTNTPPLKSRDPNPCLSIERIVQCEAELAGSDTLGRALDALPLRNAGYNLATLSREEEGEHVLSARSFGRGEIRDAYERAWSRLDECHRPVVEVAELPRAVIVAPPPIAQAYLTPPSSPEPVRKRALATVADVDDLSLDAESTLVNDSPNGSLENEVINADSDAGYSGNTVYEDEDMDFDWSEDGSNRSENGEEDATEDSDIKMSLNPAVKDSYVHPSHHTHLSELRKFATSPTNLPDLTSVLDLSSFPEWPVARGGFGDVWRGDVVGYGARCVDDAKLLEESGGWGSRRKAVAIKRLTMYTDDGEEGVRKIIKRTAREIYIWSHLRHRNVLPLLGTCSFRGGIGIVSPWQEAGNATVWVNRNPSVNRIQLCEGICAGLAYLHRSNVIHGDLRGANVLISAHGTPRLIDFGLASIVGGIPAFSASSAMAGTAPELQVGESHGTTAASDIFALGMTILELHTGAPPFSKIRNDIAVLLKYQRGERPPRPVPGRINRTSKDEAKLGRNLNVCVAMDDVWDLVQECWDQDAESRPCSVTVLRQLQRQRKRLK